MRALLFKILLTLGALLCVGTGVSVAATTPLGAVRYIEGQVSLNGADLSTEQQTNPVLQAGSVVATQQGKAELSMLRRMLLTLGENTRLKVAAASERDVQISLEQGQMIIVAGEELHGESVTVLDGGASVVIKSPGWYRVAAGNAPTAAVIRGGSAEARYGESHTKISKGRMVALTQPLTQQKFQIDEKDALYRWTKVLSEYEGGDAAPPDAEDNGDASQAAVAPIQAPGLSSIFQRGDVALSVVVLDGQHQPVGDLRANDFHVADGGKEQQILSFDVRRKKTPRPSMIVLDLLNARISDRARAVNEIAQTVRSLESTDQLYLYVIAANGGIYPVHAIPDKPAEIAEQSRPWSLQVKSLLDGVIHKVNQLRTADMRDMDIRTQASLQDVEGLAARLATFPGRKDLIWVTHGVPDVSYWADYTSSIATLGTKLNWADIAVYTVQQSATVGLAPASSNTLATLSQLTGGRSYGTDAAEQAIEQSRVDSRLEYFITYKAPPSERGKYRKVRVTCDRPGVQVLSQQGYYSVR